MTLKFPTEQVQVLVAQLQPQASLLEAGFQKGVAIYGAGFVGTWACRYLQSIGATVASFIDRDPRKIGGQVSGIQVVSLDSEGLCTVPGIFIAARHAIREVERSLARLGCPNMSFDAYFVVKNYERLATVRDGFLVDERSIETFNALLVAMLRGDTESCRAVMEKDMYFGVPEFAGNFDETFVDAGAFVGDSVERFMWENLGTFRHVYAFEPGLRQFRAMEKRVARLAEEWAFAPSTVSLVNAGLSSSEGEMVCTFVDDSPLRHGLAAGQSGQTVPVYSLDQYLGGKSITFLKADVEGMEMELLRGAEGTIRRHKPKLALCVYHYPSDLYEVAEYVRSLVPEYTFTLRQHAPIFGDFVLYCSVK